MPSKKITSFDELFLYFDSEFDEFIDFIGPAHRDVILNFFNRALSLDSNTLIQSLVKENGYISITFSNYTNSVKDDMQKIEEKLKKVTSQTCEITGSAGVHMSNGSTSRILDPSIAPTNYEVVIDENSSYLLHVIDNLLKEHRIFKTTHLAEKA